MSSEDDDESEEELEGDDSRTKRVPRGKNVCHIDGCNIPGPVTEHFCISCNRNVHTVCCTRVLNIQNVEEKDNLYCSDCWNELKEPYKLMLTTTTT